MHNARRPTAAPDAARAQNYQASMCGHGGHTCLPYIGGLGREIAGLRAQICELRNARRSAAASRSASVLKHEVGACGYGGRIYTSYLGGPGGEYRLLEVKFCEYAMRGSPPPHRVLLVFSDKK